MPTAVANPTNLKLKPRVDALLEELLSEQELVQDLVDGLGSPLNLVFPENLEHNIKLFKQSFQKNAIVGRIFFAHKCNQSDALTRQLSLEDCSIDVSSVKELQHALSNGFTPPRIEVTGPKTMELLALAVQHAAWINLDSIAELKDLIYVSRRLVEHPPLQVLLRLADFRSEHSRFLNKGSRFGISIDELNTALDELESVPQIELAGFSFHLDTVSILERTVAVENCLEAFETAVNRGFAPRILDIGGGYKVNYLESSEDWNRYTSALKEAVLGTSQSITWQGNSFGLHTEKGVLKGNFNSYNYYDGQTGGEFLDELLNQKLPSMGNVSVASVLRDNMIELWIEPGRALLDQCGVTIAKVESVRRASSGDTLVNLSMKRQDVCFLDQEIFVDPIIVRRAERDTASASNPSSSSSSTSNAADSTVDSISSTASHDEQAVYFAGNLCLESDLIYRHKTFVDALPEPGDFVAFVNTAGYFMDFSASQSIMQPVARKVAIARENGRLRWFLDDRFSPFSKR